MNEEEVSRGLLAIADQTPELRIDVGQAIKARTTRRRRMVTAAVAGTTIALAGVVTVVSLPSGQPHEVAKPPAETSVPGMGPGQGTAYVQFRGGPVPPPNVDVQNKARQLADYLAQRVANLAPSLRVFKHGEDAVPGWDAVINGMIVRTTGGADGRLFVRTFGPQAGKVMRQAPPSTCLVISDGPMRPDIGGQMCIIQPDGSALERSSQGEDDFDLPAEFGSSAQAHPDFRYTAFKHYRLDGSVVEVWLRDQAQGQPSLLDNGVLEKLATDPLLTLR